MRETVPWIVPHIALSALWSEMATFIFLTALIFSHVTKIVPTLCWKKKKNLVWLNTFCTGQ